MRCLTIADEVVRQGGEVCFIVSDEESVLLIKKKNYPIIITHSCWNNVIVENEYNLLNKIFHKDDVLCVDSYYINSDYLTAMKKKVKIAVFDDLFSEKKDANILINYNIYYDKFDYKNRYRNSSCLLLLGQKYVPLREQFIITQVDKVAHNMNHPNILLMCGGGDEMNMICSCLDAVYKFSDTLFHEIKWRVVIGNYYPYENILRKFSKKNSNIDILKNVDNMAELMSNCDLCITAASTVLYECCAMQLPTMFMIVAENQKYDAEYFAKDHMMEFCGDFMHRRQDTLKNMCNILEQLIYDKKQQKRMKAQMKKIIDGYGAKRIVNALLGGIVNE